MKSSYCTRLAIVVLAGVASCGGRGPGAAPATPAPRSVTPAVTTSGYDRPPQHVLDVLHAPTPPSPHLSPTRDKILLVTSDEYPSISHVAEPFVALAGVRVEPQTRRRHDRYYGYGIASCVRGLEVMDIASRKVVPVAVPEAGCVESPQWSRDGKRVAFHRTLASGVELWVADAGTGKTRRLGDLLLNPMLGSTIQWLPDNATMLVKAVPKDAGPAPAASALAIGPSIQETVGAGESSTYDRRDTLSSKRDEDLFEYYATAQLVLVDVDTGAQTQLGTPAVLDDVTAAPDGEHLLVSKIQRPYSYATTYEAFAHDVEVWDRRGKVVHTVANLPVFDAIPIHGVQTGPRSFGWRATDPATLVWAEALDGGDWSVKVPARDKVMMHAAPFSGEPREVARLEQRYAGFMWTERRDISLLSEYDANRNWWRAFLVNVDQPGSERTVLWDMSSQERYGDPGSPVYRQLDNGQWAIRVDGSSIYLSGDGASPEGSRPFLDRLNLDTRATERLFRSDADAYEFFVTFLDDEDSGRFLTWHQSPTDPPNVMLRTLGDPAAGAVAKGEASFTSTRQPVTAFPDPTPVVRKIQKRLVKYERADGVPLTFTLYLPPDYQEGTRLPALLDAYPLDYASADVAGQNSGSDQYFTRLRGYRLLLLSGYAIIDSASFPIVGDPETAYDTYIEQLVANAEAAVAKAVDLGVVDPERIAVTGHSHGALMAMNLVAHTDLFRAAIATSGAYNKTLTAFGFQSERRTVWKARDVYIKASPLFYADEIEEPVLLIHGADDSNPGTTPLQSKKMYEAIRGTGGTARLVMLPHEPHWYAAMESHEQVAFEELRWLDKYVKNAPPRAPAKRSVIESR